MSDYSPLYNIYKGAVNKLPHAINDIINVIKKTPEKVSYLFFLSYIKDNQDDLIHAIFYCLTITGKFILNSLLSGKNIFKLSCHLLITVITTRYK